MVEAQTVWQGRGRAGIARTAGLACLTRLRENNHAGNIPVLTVCERSLAEAYEKALIALYEHGILFRTQYDKPDDPPSLDCTMNMTVMDPLADPMIHKAFPGGIEDLHEYVLEVQGIPAITGEKPGTILTIPAGNTPTTGRLEHYGQWREKRDGQSVWTGPMDINQIERVVSKLSEIRYLPGADDHLDAELRDLIATIRPACNPSGIVS